MKLIKILKEAPVAGTIHVDDVSVEDGIYVAKTEYYQAQYVSKTSSGYYYTRNFVGSASSINYGNLRDLIEKDPTDIFIHIPTGLRVTTEKLETDYVLWEDIASEESILGCDNYGNYAITDNEDVFLGYTYYKIVK
jgi:hypothetical protein